MPLNCKNNDCLIVNRSPEHYRVTIIVMKYNYLSTVQPNTCIYRIQQHFLDTRVKSDLKIYMFYHLKLTPFL